MLSKVTNIGVVIIGRNEGVRLHRCIDSVLKECSNKYVVYVDSGSNDGSKRYAQERNIKVVALESGRPFTAARARNEGFRSLLEQRNDLKFIQFVDGDCLLEEGWLDAALAYLIGNSQFAICSGRRREVNPNNSVYNRLCELEWKGASEGEVMECGGDFMVRVSAFTQALGFNDLLIAGEEPELCLRLRKIGWKIWRLSDSMTLHNADMNKFSQWALRAKRSGYAYAVSAILHGTGNERFKVKEVLSILLWSLVIPLVIALGVFIVGPIFLTLLVIYPLKVVQVYMRFKSEFGARGACEYSVFIMLAKIPQLWGISSCLWRTIFDMEQVLVEYK